jgi:hypothetical protein
MSNRTLIYSTLFVILGMVILLALNMTSILTGEPINQTYLKYNNVRGMAIRHDQLLYTLNFQQQNSVIELLNKSILLTKETPANGEKANFDRIIVYQFNGKPDILIKPIGYDSNKNLLFSMPQISSEGNFMELSEGDLQSLLSQTYDP